MKSTTLKRRVTLLLISILSLLLISCSTGIVVEDETKSEEIETVLEIEIISEKTPTELEKAEETLDEDGYYTSKEEVALYIYTYDKLPDNFISKNEARTLGWESNEGNLWDVTDNKSIGGDRFGNREGLLPEGNNRQYYECDINYEGGYRGGERLVYSDDGLIYYTSDHYESFELLYGEEWYGKNKIKWKENEN